MGGKPERRLFGRIAVAHLAAALRAKGFSPSGQSATGSRYLAKGPFKIRLADHPVHPDYYWRHPDVVCCFEVPVSGLVSSRMAELAGKLLARFEQRVAERFAQAAE